MNETHLKPYLSPQKGQKILSETFYFPIGFD